MAPPLNYLLWQKDYSIILPFNSFIPITLNKQKQILRPKFQIVLKIPSVKVIIQLWIQTNRRNSMFEKEKQHEILYHSFTGDNYA